MGAIRGGEAYYSTFKAALTQLNHFLKWWQFQIFKENIIVKENEEFFGMFWKYFIWKVEFSKLINYLAQVLKPPCYYSSQALPYNFGIYERNSV